MGEIASRIVLITGGSRGIGRATAYAFAEEGARLVLAHYDPDETAADETLAVLKSRGVEAESHRVDISSYAAAAALIDDIVERFGRVDVLVNNAGITRDKILVRMSEEEWDAVIRVNLKSVFNCTQAVLKPMMKQRAGCIVSISSVVAERGNFGQGNYAASKAGILGFTRSVAREVASRAIRVNAVAPGFIETDMTAVLPEKVKASFIEQIPLGRMGQSEDVANAVYWLCSNKAAYLTGQVIHVNGGLYM
ncbi:3-oxoacyl-[acyl-carrier-protein] reductase [Desulfatiglans anilini]|uniref:3-oxoacyl-[acyl-carrier-protein] reductase n=1 Tax=Desulfatiglans anilini TaxID=90728 RepID=UPI000403B4E6|nr:3-oxoacyl-[acyl-carrier-protein] reductase [Desulfatiglans anilini]